MKKYLFIFGIIFINTTANAQDYVFNQTVSSFDEDANIVNGVTITPPENHDIIISETTVVLHNNGNINGRINTNGNNLIVYNTGTISGGIISDTNIGEVHQIINSHSEITNINVTGVNHIVDINYSNQNISFADIKDLHATSFKLSNVHVVINDFSEWQNWSKSVSLDGVTWLDINDANIINYSGEEISNIVSGADKLNVTINNLDSFYTIELTSSGQTKTLNLVHEANNDNIANNNTNTETNANNNGPLEQLREKDPNDKLIKTLDAARNNTEFHNAQNRSYRYNHGILLRPVKIINNFSMFNQLEKNDDLGMGAHASYIISDTTNDFGGRIYAGNKFENLYLNIGFNFNSFSYEDRLNDFSGRSYGLDIHARQNFEIFWIDGLAGITLVQYDADYITKNNKLKENPFGSSEYAKIDVGHDFDILPDFTISPFVGSAFQQYDVADVSDFDFAVRGGTDVKYVSIMDGIKYEYVLSGAVATNGDWFSSLKIGFWSITDKVGASVNAGVFKNDIEYHYKLSTNAKTVF